MTQLPSQEDAFIDLTAEDEEDELIVLWENHVEQVKPAQSAQDHDIEVIFEKRGDEHMECDDNDCQIILEKLSQKRESTSSNATRFVPSPSPALQLAPHLSSPQLARGHLPIEIEVDEPGLLEVSPGITDHAEPPARSVAMSSHIVFDEQMPEEPATPTEKAPTPVMLMEQDSTPGASEVTVEQMPEEGQFRAPLPITAPIKKGGSSKKKNTEKLSEVKSKRRCVRFNETATEMEISATFTSTAPSNKAPKVSAPDPTVWRQDKRRNFSIRTSSRQPSPTPPDGEEKDVPESNYTSQVKFYVSRDPAIPTGLTRVPFHVELPQKQFSEIFSKLKIEKDNKFPESVEKGTLYSRKGEPDDSGFVGYPDDSGNCPKGLAKLEKYLGPNPDQNYMKEKDKEELMWSADALEDFLKRKKTKEDEFYRDVKEKYLFAIWRQFEGHIPPEFALQNLMKRHYKIPKALDTIDQYLKVLPQKLKDPSVSQVQVLSRELKAKGDWFDLRKIQDDSMRNFHIGEIFNYHVKFQRFFGVDNDKRESGGGGLNGRIACNCMEPMCRQLDFEPRYGCFNCTKSLRKHPLASDKLCLICRTYKEITGNTRPAKKVVFDDEDMEKISLWDQKCKKMDRREFEKWIQNGKNKRYQALELTQEEALMLNFEKIRLKDKMNIGDQVKSMLQPFKLPHFSHCQCQYSGSIPVGTPNFGRTKFSEEEEQRFVAAISRTPGNIKAAAAELEVEEELVEVFLRTYKVGNNVWKGLRRSAKIHVYPPREILPPINPPPVIPKNGKVQK